jgi:hypothetical protein
LQAGGAIHHAGGDCACRPLQDQRDIQPGANASGENEKIPRSPGFWMIHPASLLPIDATVRQLLDDQTVTSDLDVIDSWGAGRTSVGST